MVDGFKSDDQSYVLTFYFNEFMYLYHNKTVVSSE